MAIAYGDFVAYRGRIYLCVYAGQVEERPLLRLRYLTGSRKEFWASMPEIAERVPPPSERQARRAKKQSTYRRTW